MSIFKGYKLYKTAKQEGVTPYSFIDDLVTLWRMVRQYFSGNYAQVQKRSIVKIALGILYLVFFIDLIPDFIPFIGWLDDIAVLFFIYRSLKTEISRFRKWESEQNTTLHT